jgi:serine/threonine protein kinase
MSGLSRRKYNTDSDHALRELVSSILSGRYTEETYLADVSSVCRARPNSGPRLISLVDRSARLGRMQAGQQQRIKARIEEVLLELRQPLATPAAPARRPAEPVAAGQLPAQDDDEDEDCSTSELVASPKSRRPAALGPAPLTMVSKPVPVPQHEPASADDQANELTKVIASAAPSSELSPSSATRMLPPDAPSPMSPPPTSPRVRQPDPAPAPPVGHLPPEPPLESAETRILSEARQTRAIHGPTLVALPEFAAAAGTVDTPLSERIGAPSARSAPARDATLVGSASIGVGTVLHDRYELKQLLGRGGIATVYKAVDRYRVNLGLEDCYVAVKIVQPHPSRPGSVAALGREFHNAQLLSHPNVINVFNIDHAGDASFYTMELLDGERLSQVAKRVGLLSRRHALTIIRDIGAAVSHAHSRGVVHADLKPHNIMITQVGSLRVLDWGSGIIRAREPWISELSPGDNYRQATPAYASCEQLEGWSADPRDDIYALACVAYLLLAGRHPFDMQPSLEARAKRMQPRRPPGLSGESWRALQRGLSWTREKRTMSLEDWMRDLGVGAAAEALPPLSLLHAGRPPGTWLHHAAAASVIIAGLGLAAFTVEHQDEFDWQGTLSRAHDKLHGAWESLTEDTSADAADQPAVSLPPIPAPTPVVTQKNIKDLPPAPNALATRTPQSPNMAQRLAAGRDGSTGEGVIATATATTVDAAPAAEPSAAESGSAPHLAFSAPSYVVAGTEPAARIIIRRNGSTDGDVNFVWWTEEASAKADIDYASLGRRVERIPAGTDKITVYVPIISSSQRRETTQFYVALSEPGQHGGAMESRSLVTIDNGD